MEIAVMTCFSAEGNMKVNAGQGVRKFECATKLRSYRHWLVLLLLLITAGTTRSQYSLNILPVDHDTVFIQKLGLTGKFSDKQTCLNYIGQLPELLSKKGYASASVDSLWTDSTTAGILLYIGEQFHWGHLNVSGLTTQELQLTGIIFPKKTNLPFSSQAIDKLQITLLNWMSDNGYPFATVRLDSIELTDGLVNGTLEVKKGMPYQFDSIHLIGNAKISDRFLQRYLDLQHGSKYRLKTFSDISPRLRDLPYLQEARPWAMHFGGNGAVLDLYLEPRKSSQVNVLLGLLPTTNAQNENKLQITGEANLNLRNALGNGETIGLNWQQLQIKSPRLNLLYQQPYLFGSAFGIHTQFDLFKKDSSFLNLNGILGLQYAVSARQTGKVFLQLFKTNLVAVDTQKIKSTKQLPADIDMGIYNLGVDYELFTTNYRRNPRRGWELFSGVTAGTRTIRKNNAILDIKDPSFNYASLYDTVDLNSYQFRLKGRIAKFIPLGRQATLQLLVSGGWVQSPELYRNELFQIGGYKLMRGFDEESIYASRYLVNTLEYRYLLGMNSYFFLFTDLGFTYSKSSIGQEKNHLIGLGAGMAFETAAGFFNLSLAVGKQDDSNFNLRQTKIHLGYVNYF
jgi:outer membrane protein assembly factor BamA